MRADIKHWVDRILREPNRQQRRALLQQVPYNLLARVELEVRAAWDKRKAERVQA